MKNIAPTLQRHIDECFFPSKDGPDAQKELRALLAVARAARKIQRIDGDGSNTEVPTDYWQALKEQREALARLDRASGKTGGGAP
jgi:hypothetical protein